MTAVAVSAECDARPVPGDGPGDQFQATRAIKSREHAASQFGGSAGPRLSSAGLTGPRLSLRGSARPRLSSCAPASGPVAVHNPRPLMAYPQVHGRAWCGGGSPQMLAGGMHRQSLPEGALSLEQARGLGLTDRQWRSPRLHRVTRGVRSTTPCTSVIQQAQALVLVLPEPFAFSHATAAQLLGLPLPSAHEAGLMDVMRPSGTSLLTRHGCVGHRGLEGRSTWHIRGLPVVSAVDTWVDLAALRRPALDVDDLVVVGDAIAAHLGNDPASTSAQFAEALRVRTRPRGAAALAQALPLLRPGVRSPMETRARLMFVRGGFPEPEINGILTDDYGEWLMECDLVWRAARVVVEYQGDPHAGLRARSRDAAKRRLAEQHGWRFHEIFAEDVFRSARRVAVLTAVARDLGLPPHTLDLQ